MERTPASSRTRTVLRLVDSLALIAFVLVGIRSHYGAAGGAVLLRNALPLLVAWFVTALVVGTYRRPSTSTLLVTWVLAVPVGLIARSIIVGSPTGSRFVTFLGVGLVFTLLCLAVGRALAGVIGSRVLPVGRRT